MVELINNYKKLIRYEIVNRSKKKEEASTR